MSFDFFGALIISFLVFWLGFLTFRFWSCSFDFCAFFFLFSSLVPFIHAFRKKCFVDVDVVRFVLFWFCFLHLFLFAMPTFDTLQVECVHSVMAV